MSSDIGVFNIGKTGDHDRGGVGAFPIAISIGGGDFGTTMLSISSIADDVCRVDPPWNKNVFNVETYC
jgi:hypothetical protein